MCKVCHLAQWRRDHPAEHLAHFRRHVRKSQLKGYGITEAEYEQMWRRQGGACANPDCRAVFPPYSNDGIMRTKLQIDHDHVTGRVRGLLCQRCNSALGYMRDDIPRLRGLIEYLAAGPIAAAGLEILN